MKSFTQPVLWLALVFAAGSAGAQAPWPQREVKVLIGFSAGGTTDIVTRLIAADLSQAWGRPLVIENRAGAAGNIAAEMTAKSKPDGYSLMMGSVGPLAVNPSLYKAMTYDPLRDLSPISLVAHVPNMLVVSPRAMQAETVAQFLAAVKASPGKYF